jgi:hypothetical protein
VEIYGVSVCPPVFRCCYFTRLFGFAGCSYGDQGTIALESSLRGLMALIDPPPRIINIYIDRSNILQSSLNEFQFLVNDDLESTLKVHFDKEDGYDAGGLFKEWMTIITPKLFCWPLFLNVVERSMILPVLRLNPIPTLNFDDADACHSHLRLLGAVLGFSVRKRIPLGVELTPSFCKLLLQQEPNFEDLRHEMPHEFETLKNIKKILDDCETPEERQAKANAWFNSDGDPMLFDTPSRRQQIKDFINALRPSIPAEGWDQPRSDLVAPTGTHTFVSGDNFSDFINATVRKQLSSNLEGGPMPHIRLAFEAAAGTSAHGMSYEGLQQAIEGEADGVAAI